MPKVIYTDNSLEFGKVCEELSWNHCTSAPHRSETNGIAERTVRRIKERTPAVLLQSGLDEKWWADPTECYCFLQNIQGLLSDGKIISFDSLVEYHRRSTKDQLRIHKFCNKVLPDIFFGYVLYAEGMWMDRRHHGCGP